MSFFSAVRFRYFFSRYPVSRDVASPAYDTYDLYPPTKCEDSVFLKIMLVQDNAYKAQSNFLPNGRTDRLVQHIAKKA